MIQDAFVALILKQQMVNVRKVLSGMVKVIDSQITETFHTSESARLFFTNKILKFMAYNQKMLKNAPTFDYGFHI